jgi:hypothetical protein
MKIDVIRSTAISNGDAERGGDLDDPVPSHEQLEDRLPLLG